MGHWKTVALNTIRHLKGICYFAGFMAAEVRARPHKRRHSYSYSYQTLIIMNIVGYISGLGGLLISVLCFVLFILPSHSRASSHGATPAIYTVGLLSNICPTCPICFAFRTSSSTAFLTPKELSCAPGVPSHTTVPVVATQADSDNVLASFTVPNSYKRLSILIVFGRLFIVRLFEIVAELQQSSRCKRVVRFVRPLEEPL